MNKNTHSIKRFFFYAILIIITSCNKNNHNKEGVELAMKQYDHLIKNMDADSIALLYTSDGSLGDVVYGRDSIRKFLLSFKNVSVISQSSTTNFLEINGDSSLQKGAYLQTVYIPGKDTIKVKGEYTASWLWMSTGGWHIKRMITKPLK
jgi:ketosteroid isomerase-like protein